jgi:chemotaxis protein methyltransferase CheR
MWNSSVAYSDDAEPASSLVGGAPLSERNFVRICAVIREACGIHITAKKKTLVEGRMRRRMRALNIADPNAYSRLLLEGDPAQEELTHFIDAVTTNKTDFFREPKHFEYLRDNNFPRALAEGQRSLKIWSAASSTGAEAYTLAMVADDYFAGQSGFDFSILATDICSEVLDKGVSALYPLQMMEPIPEEFRRHYIMIARDPSRQEFRIAPKLRSKVQFQRLNLVNDSYPFERDYDIIFLRNVLIYFDRATQKAVLQKLSAHLRPGGHLFLGHSETLAGSGLPFEQVASTIFVRR